MYIYIRRLHTRQCSYVSKSVTKDYIRNMASLTDRLNYSYSLISRLIRLMDSMALEGLQDLDYRKIIYSTDSIWFKTDFNGTEQNVSIIWYY